VVYLSLFIIAFLSATLLPLGSEALLIYDISEGYSLLLLWIFATMGNTLGSILNYLIGRKGETYLQNKGYLSKDKMSKAKALFSKYGGWTLLLSWLPIIGDPLTFIAGVFAYNFRYFILIVFIAKGLRYLGIILLIGYA
jgi:membrane protein YqaA with SNARE-associated domain